MSKYITKSSYVDFCHCPRLYYLNKYCKEYADDKNEYMQLLANNGKKVGDLARSYFANSITIDKNSNEKMYEDTLNAIKAGNKVICEASFIYEDLFCAVDILKVNDDDSVEIYEVKSVTEIKDKHKWDASFQNYVLTKLGYNVSKTRLLIIDNGYVYKDKFNVQEYFKEVEFDLFDDIEENIELIRHIDCLADLKACKNCKRGNNEYCPYFNYCFKDLTQYNVFNIGGLHDKYKYYNDGIITYDDIYDKFPNLIESYKRKKKGCKLLEAGYDQVARYIEKKGDEFKDEKVKVFLEGLKYPLYYLDFETYRDVIPFINGEKPNYQRVTQYSLHIQNSECLECSHKEYLQEDEYDNIEEVIVKLIEDLDSEGSIIVYHKDEEKGRIKSLINFYPKYRQQLENICLRIVDLEVLFKNRVIYNDNMFGRSTIKLVLPSFVPEYKDAYDSLPSVHNGTQAMVGYEKLINKEYKYHDKLKEDMLAYCKLDTLAMVKIIEKMYSKINNK